MVVLAPPRPARRELTSGVVDVPTEVAHPAVEGAPPIGAAPAGAEEIALVEALQAGDGVAFGLLIERYGTAMLRVARTYVASAEAAEDVVQETWMGVVRGIDRFEGRSSLKTWIFRILANRARTRGSRDARSTPFSTLEGAEEDLYGTSVEPERFMPDGRWAGHWAAPPARLPEELAVGHELRANLEKVIERLPARQRAVIILRDIEGLSATEACEVLGLSDANQRVLLHRARCRARAQLEAVLGARGLQS